MQKDNNPKSVLDCYRHISLNHTLASTAPQSIIDDLLSHLEGTEPTRSRKRKANDRANLKTTLEAFVLEAYVAFGVNPDRYIAYSRAKGMYANSSRYVRAGIKHQGIVDVVSFLTNHGFIENHIGFQDRTTEVKRLSRFRATPKLIGTLESYGLERGDIKVHPSAETVKLKDAAPSWNAAKPLVDYVDNEFTNDMRTSLIEINQVLDAASVNLNIPLGETVSTFVNASNIDADNEGDQDIDIHSKYLYRVFNNNTFDNGGRLYGVWWQQLGKSFRSCIVIENEPTVELDYKALHPNMLYHLEGLTFPSDEDPYMLEGFGPEHRAALKVLWNKMLNGKSQRHAVVSDEEECLLINGLKYQDIITMMLEYHAPIADHFYSSIGLRLQRIDSDIAMSILSILNEKGIVALPIHDSFIVKEKHQHILYTVMREAYKSILDQYPSIEVVDTLSGQALAA